MYTLVKYKIYLPTIAYRSSPRLINVRSSIFQSFQYTFLIKDIFQITSYKQYIIARIIKNANAWNLALYHWNISHCWMKMSADLNALNANNYTPFILSLWSWVSLVLYCWNTIHTRKFYSITTIHNNYQITMGSMEPIRQYKNTMSKPDWRQCNICRIYPNHNGVI